MNGLNSKQIGFRRSIWTLDAWTSVPGSRAVAVSSTTPLPHSVIMDLEEMLDLEAISLVLV